MRKIFPVVTALALFATTAGFVSMVKAATVTVLASDYSVSNCSTDLGFGSNCFHYDNKITASVSGNTVTAINPITAYVGDTIAISRVAGNHNMIFCAAGSVIDGWTCGDPMSTTNRPTVSQDASGPGAPTKIGFSFTDASPPSSASLTTAGTFYFWCGIGNHATTGQYGKLLVLSERPATTVSTTTPTVAPSTTTATTATRPTLTIKKAAGKVTASGRAEPGSKVLLQKQVGKSWATVASGKVAASGSYSVKARAESRSTSYRVKVGSVVSPTRKA